MNIRIAGSALIALGLIASHDVAAQTAATRADGQKVPPFIQQTYPEQAVNAANQERQAIEGNGALDAKSKELIGLAVAAQIPCDYCVYYHTMAAKHDGATNAQIKEAIAVAAETRKWSTVLNGSQYDLQKFKHEVDASLGGH